MTANKILRPGDEHYDALLNKFRAEKGGDVTHAGKIFTPITDNEGLYFVERGPATGVPEAYETVSMSGPSVNPMDVVPPPVVTETPPAEPEASTVVIDADGEPTTKRKAKES